MISYHYVITDCSQELKLSTKYKVQKQSIGISMYRIYLVAWKLQTYYLSMYIVVYYI